MTRLLAIVLLLLSIAGAAGAAEPRLWIVTAPAGNLADCPSRAEKAVREGLPEARLLSSDALVSWPDYRLPLRGDTGEPEDIHRLADNCFALFVSGQPVVSGAILRPESARLLRFPVLVLETRKKGWALRFTLAPAFPAKHASNPGPQWAETLSKFYVTTFDIDHKVGALGALSRFIGTFHYDAVLDNPDVNAALDAAMGKPEKAALRRNLGVMAPIAFSDEFIILQGNKPHAGATDTAILAIRLSDGAVHAVIHRNGTVKIYRSANDRDSTPDAVTQFAEEARRIVEAWKELDK